MTERTGTGTGTDKWVACVNAQARHLDELASVMHPSSWSEQLKPDLEKYIKTCESGPKGE